MTQLLPVASAAQVRHALAELARPYRLRITLAGLVLVAGTATVLLAPPLLGAIVDLVVGGAPAAAITGPVLGLLGVAVAAGVLDAIGRALVASSGEPILATLRESVMDRAGPMYAAERSAEGARAQQMLGSIEGVGTVRAFRLARTHTERIAERSRAAVAISLHTTAQQTRFFGRLNIAELIGTSAVLLVGFMLVRADAITVGAATADTEAAIRAVRDANPSLVGKTVTYSFAYEPGKIVTLKSAQDPSVKLLQDLGMQLPTSVRSCRTSLPATRAET